MVGESKGRAKLNESEVKILNLYLRGYRSPSVIAEKVGLRPSTVKWYLWKMRRWGVLRPMSAVTALRLRLQYVLRVLEKARCSARLSGASAKELDEAVRELRYALKLVTSLERELERVEAP